MKLMKRNRKMWLVVASIFILALLPATSLSQGRGRGQDKKLDKFVNGHDARNGRWDGRGPGYSRRTLIGNDMRHRRSNRFRNQDFYGNDRRRVWTINDQSLRSQRSRRWNRRLNRRGF